MKVISLLSKNGKLLYSLYGDDRQPVNIFLAFKKHITQEIN